MSFSLTTSYIGDSLLSGFNWFDGADLSHGFVKYQNQDVAQSLGLVSVDPGTQVVRLSVDHTNTFALDEGRPSIRIESKESFNHGLFIADFLHMPPSQCGVWPAFWAYGSSWPDGGELDIIEGANDAHNNIISGHTSNGCSQDPPDAAFFTGEQRNDACAVDSNNIGCGFNPPETDVSSYGDGFNAMKGGVYAMLWDSDFIKIWHFARDSIPQDIGLKAPNPATWGLPQARFGGQACDVDSHWKNMSLVINTNFCGDYGNAIWGQGACSQYASSCPEYVANNPDAFTNVYWDIGYIDVYAQGDLTNSSGLNVPATLPPPTSSIIPASLPPATNSTINESSNTTSHVPSQPQPLPPSNVTEDVQPNNPVPASLPPPPTSSANNASSNTTALIHSQPQSLPPVNVTGVTGPSNSIKINDFVYLGCFNSRTDFQTFTQITDTQDMTLEQCVEACSGKHYAGIYDTTCYCAQRLDAGTRADSDETQCNSACPGNETETCGGLVPVDASIPASLPAAALGQAKLSVPLGRSNASSPFNQSDPSAALGRTRLNPLINQTNLVVPVKQAFVRPSSKQPILLTVYGAVMKDDPAPPPPMATGLAIVPKRPSDLPLAPTAEPVPPPMAASLAPLKTVTDLAPNETVLVTTTVTYTTVNPTFINRLLQMQTVVTLTVTHCGCATPPPVEVQMRTEVVPCDCCGARGESEVTLRIPVDVPRRTSMSSAASFPLVTASTTALYHVPHVALPGHVLPPGLDSSTSGSSASDSTGSDSLGPRPGSLGSGSLGSGSSGSGSSGTGSSGSGLPGADIPGDGVSGSYPVVTAGAVTNIVGSSTTIFLGSLLSTLGALLATL